MKTTTTLLVYALILGITFGSCDNDYDFDNPTPVATPTQTSPQTPTPNTTPSPTSTSTSTSNTTPIDGFWRYDKMSSTIDGVTSPEVDFNFNGDSKCSKYSIIAIEPGTIHYNIARYGILYDDKMDCVSEYNVGTWTLHEDKYTIPIVVGYKMNDVKMEMITDFFELVSVSSTELKVKSYPKSEEGKITVTNITFINDGPGW